MGLESQISRRGLIQAAGGFTFFALAPKFDGFFESTVDHVDPMGQRLPVFTAIPYLQPGPAGSRLIDGQESMLIVWQTDSVMANFEVTYGRKGASNVAEVVRTPRNMSFKRESDRRVNYSAKFENLSLGAHYEYQVRMDGKLLIEGYFTTRKPRGKKVRFVAFGDNSLGQISDRAIAYQAYQARPDFVMNTGDNVYNGGLDNEYARYFFPVYNADIAGPRIGAPLLRSVPFYSVMANHDINSSDDHGPMCDFDRHEDGLGIYTNLHLPLNGPEPRFPTPIKGASGPLKEFKNAVGDRFPRMANYSFDYGDGHFLCLDSNTYTDPTDPDLQNWISKDLAETDAVWKIVVYHHPAFNVGNEHYDEQHMRVIAPILEKHQVDLVLSGHEHNYQRTRPLRFEPSDVSNAKAVGKGRRIVPGKFSVDRDFDGKKMTRPSGIIYITTGAGGNSLYDAEMNEEPHNWLHEEDLNADYVYKMISDRHSLTIIDMDRKSLTWTQVDEWGQEIDRAVITKN